MTTTIIGMPGERTDGRLVALAILLGGALVVGSLVNWWLAAAVLALGILLAAFPLAPFPALLAATALATFVNNEGGHLTRELSVVTAVFLYAMLCVLIAWVGGRWKLPAAALTTAILALEVSTIAAAAHGVLAGHNLRYLGLELLPMLGLTIALMVGGLRLGTADLRLAYRVLVIVALGHVGLGLYSYEINRMRAGGIWFTPIPGLAALLLLNFALRQDRPKTRLGIILLMSACMMQQLISLTRGYWMGVVVGFVVSSWLYAGRGSGAGGRWRRVFGVCAWMVGLLVVAVAALGSFYGWGDVAAMLGTRLASSLGTQHSSETASNVERLLEWVLSWRLISQAPWFGHGLGLTLHLRYPLIDQVSTQWFVHQLYLWMWIKQGLVGLVCLVAVLVVAIRTGTGNARRLPAPETGWAAGAAAATAYVAALALTNYPMAQVNSTFLMVLLWGIALALGRPVRWRLVWRNEPGATGQQAPGRA